MSYFYRYSTCFNVFIPRPVTTSFDRFFTVPVRGSCILKLSGTGPVRGPSKKGNRTETGPDFKALAIDSADFIPSSFNNSKNAFDANWGPRYKFLSGSPNRL